MMQNNSGFEKNLNDWIQIFNKKEDYYLYGAANTAKKVIELAKKTGVFDKIKGCVVSEMADNPTELLGLPVITICELHKKESVILVPHTAVFKREIVSLLNDLGFFNIEPIHSFANLLTKERVFIDDEFSKRVEERIRQINIKSEEEHKRDSIIREKIARLREAENPDFSENQFYQSLEKIGVTGRRPTLYRIEKYNIESYLSESSEILDIGCNVGFFDMTVAPLVGEITGIEYDATLVEIANVVKNYLEIDNCYFYNSDFIEWEKQNQKTYDIIFSFAIHHWLNISPEQYTTILNKLLKSEGVLFIESHDLTSGDFEYEKCISLLKDMQYKVLQADEIIDDGLTPRKFTVLKKQ